MTEMTLEEANREIGRLKEKLGHAVGFEKEIFGMVGAHWHEGCKCHSGIQERIRQAVEAQRERAAQEAAEKVWRHVAVDGFQVNGIRQQIRVEIDVPGGGTLSLVSAYKNGEVAKKVEIPLGDPE